MLRTGRVALAAAFSAALLLVVLDADADAGDGAGAGAAGGADVIGVDCAFGTETGGFLGASWIDG